MLTFHSCTTNGTTVFFFIRWENIHSCCPTEKIEECYIFRRFSEWIQWRCEFNYARSRMWVSFHPCLIAVGCHVSHPSHMANDRRVVCLLRSNHALLQGVARCCTASGCGQVLHCWRAQCIVGVVTRAWCGTMLWEVNREQWKGTSYCPFTPQPH